MWIERYVFFTETSTSTAATLFFNTLNFTITFAHTHTLAHTQRSGQVVPDFSGFVNIFDHMWSARVFLTVRGSRNIRKYFQSAINVFSCLCMYYFLMQALCCNKITLGKLLICKAQLLEINRVPTAG